MRRPAPLLAAVVAVAGLWAAGTWMPGNGHSKGSAAMAGTEDLGPMRTWCIGRHLIDLPARFRPVETYGLVQGVRVTPIGPGDERTLADRANARVAALRGGVEEEGQILLLDGAERVGDALVIRHHADTSVLGIPPVGWTDEAWVARGGTLFLASRASGPEEGETRGRQILLAVAAALHPRAEDEIPPGPGACIPGAFVALTLLSEVHGASFTLDGKAEPLGLQIDIVLRRAPDPPPEIEGEMPSGPFARPVTIAGMEGRMVGPAPVPAIGPRELGFGAVVGREESQGAPATRLGIEYFDERPEPGAAPVPEATARALWSGLVASLRDKR